MRKFFTLRYVLLLLMSALTVSHLQAQVTLTTTGSYTQNFNGLITTGSGTFIDNSTIPNWYSQRTGTGNAYSVETGTSTTGGLYSYGSTAAADRALGTVGSGGATAGSFAHGVLLKNTSGTTITDLRVTYTLEQWRNSAAAAQAVSFYYKKSSTAITALNPNSNGTWILVSGLSLSSPIIGGSAGALDGNAAANRVTATNVSIPGLSLADNEYIMLKWDDPDHTGSDHALAIDDVTINWTVTPIISNNALLTSLVVNNSGFTSTAALTPAFNSGTNAYTASVSNATTPVFLSFTKGQANSVVDARLNGGAYGSALVSFPLNVGNNTIDVRVTAQDGVTVNTYNLTINRAAASVPILTVSSPLADFGNVCTNNTTAANSFTLDGSSLDGSNISIAALPGFSYSETVNGIYTNTLNFTSGSTLSGKVIYVKFTPTNIQSYDGNILVSGGGTNTSVAATGSGINTTPAVTTVGNIVTGTAGTLTGNITATGCTAVSSYGFEYSTTSGFVNGTGIQVTASNLNSGGFSKTVSGLTAGVTYYFKAFAVNGGGTGYGAQQSFTTSAITPIVMASQPLLRFTENFDDVANWSANFATGVGANHFSSVALNAGGTIPDGVKITTATNVFSSSTSGGVQKGTGNIILLGTGATDNTTALAIDFYMDFTGVNAGTLSFDWASVNNSTGNRNGSLRVYASNDGVSFTELVAADVINFTNNVPSTGTVSSIALPAIFNNSPTARLRFYYSNGTGGGTAPISGSRPKISIDNLTVSGIASTPCATPSAGPTSLSFGTVTETSIQGSFIAASPAVNEYLVVMSTNNSLTSNPLDGQTYFIGDNVGDGTVIAKGSELSFTATGLTGATTYYFFVFPVNSVCTGGPKYLVTDPLTDDATTVAGLPSCTAPASQATALVTTSSINSVQGSFTATAADEYLVLQSTSASLTGIPVNGVVYNAGSVIGNATVVQRNGNTTFTASGLNPATQYYYFIFSLNSQGCLNGPVYNTASPLSGTATTLPLPVCTTPSAQPTDIAFNASNNSVTATFNAAGSGYNYLVVMSTSPTLSTTPVDNSDYVAGNSLGGGTVVSNNTSTSFIANGLSNSTTYYFFVFSANKNCTGGTKYLTASPLTGNATTTNAPVNNYYFGNLHAHSDYSDGNKDHPGYTPGDDYLYASTSGMDFLGISEHNHFSSLDNPGNELANYHLGVAQAAAFNSSHTGFLALYGMEWGVISGGGHVVVYGDGLTDLFGWESNVNGHVGPNYDVYVPKSTYIGTEGLFKTVNDYVAKNAFATLAHPNNTDYNNLSNIPYDQSADDAITGVAVESGPATSTNTTYSNPASPMYYLWYFQKLLAKGYHLGPTIDHDNHNTTFGRTTPSRTAVIAPALTQSDIIYAVRNMHFYATEDVDARVDFTINTRIMGSIFEDRNAPSISVTLTDPTTSTSGALIRVLSGIPGSGVLPVVIDSVFGSSLSYVDNSLANHTTGYYYIDITNNGKRIVTSPIWYTRTCAAASDTTASVCGNFNWYGTLYTTSTVATKVFTTVGGCDSTVTLHLTVNNPPASAAVSFAGTGTGCPGTGVVLTATVADGGNGAINSYQWIQDGNTVATTTSNTYTALRTGNYSVKVSNVNNCSITSGTIAVTVVDNTAPVADAASLPTISSECAVTATTVPTATDNCAGTVTGTTSDPLTYTTQGTYTITWTYNDGNGNSSIQTQTVIVHDGTAPVANVAALPTVSGECSVTVTTVPTATDNCAGTVTGTTTDPLTYTTQGTYTITWTYNDGNGNGSTQTQTVIVHDGTAPAADAASLPTINGECAATVTTAPTATDNCAGTVTGTTTDPLNYTTQGTYTIHWTFDDGHGNTSTQQQTVIIHDQTAPVLSGVPASVNISCDASVPALPQVTANDNCDASPVVTLTETSTQDADPNAVAHYNYTITRIWTATDASGNSSSASQVIGVTDTQAPVIATLSNISQSNDAGACSAVVNFAATATDNCGPVSISYSQAPGTVFPVGVTTVTVTAKDVAGNTTSTDFTVTVTDTEKPTITAPGAYSMASTPGMCGTTISNIGTPVVNDNCGVATVTNDHPSTYYPVGTTIVTWTVTDIHGNNMDTAKQTITVIDNEWPTINVTNLSVGNTTGLCGANIVLATPATHDNCGVASVTNDHPSTFFPTGTTTVKWTVTDNNGLVTNAYQTITVTDTENPAVSTQPVTIYLDASGNATVTAAQVNNGSTDNCAIGTYSLSKTSFNCSNLGDNTVVLTVTDVNGNSSVANAIVTVKDNILPTASARSVTVYLNASGTATVTAAQVNNGSTDNCGISSYSLSKTTFNCSNLGDNAVTLTVTDASGNTNTANATVTVKDNTAPIVITQPVTVYLNASGTATITAPQVNNGSTDNCSISSYSLSKTSFNCSNLGSNTVSLTVTDASGNSSSANAIITVKDNIAPTAMAQPVIIYLDASGNATVTAAQVNNGSTDNCGISSYSLSKTNFSCSNLGSNTVSLTVTDASGNSSSVNAVVTVKDNIAPVAATQAVTVYLDASGNATVTAAQVNNGSTDNCGISSYSLSKTSFNCSNLGANTVTLTVTDASGNTNSKTAVVTVKDNTAPSFTAVPAQTFCTNTTGNYTIPVLAAADNCSSVTVSYTISGATVKGLTNGNNASGIYNAGVSTINWKVTDGSGNSVTATTTVTISALPAVVITASAADAFCNKLTLTASTTGSGATYKWTSGSSTVATTQQVSLGQSNGDGIYQVTVTIGGCTSAAASYNFQKQNLVSSYTILAFDDIDLGENNIVATGSVGVTSAYGWIDFDKNSSVSSPGSFVKAKYIDKIGQNITITNPIYSAATGIALPAMLLNTVNTNNLPNKDVAQNSVSTVTGNYKNLTLKKGSRTILTGNIFGTIHVEQGAQVTFTANSINMDKLQVVKGPRYGYSYVRFSQDTKVMVSTSVSIGSQVYINPDNNKVTFYMGDTKSDEEKFVVNGGDTKVTANVYVPNGKLKVTGGYRYGDYGNGIGDCDRDDDEDKYYGQGTSYVNMTGLFIAEEVQGNGKNVMWNSFDCSASPVPVLNTTTITQTTISGKEVITTEEELKVTVAPNPSTTYFTLKIESRYATPVSLRVMDSRGRVVDAKSEIGANSTIQIGHSYSSGTYYAELIQGNVRKVVQLIKGRG